MVPGGTVTGTTMAPADPNTGAGLIEFLDAAIEKGWFNVASVKALRTATLKVLGGRERLGEYGFPSPGREQPLRSLPQPQAERVQRRFNYCRWCRLRLDL
jgi:hypothetical protein